MAATVDQAAHAGQVADLELRDGAAHRADATDDLVARHAGVGRHAPVTVREMDVRMADAAVEDVDPHILRLQRTALEGEGRKGLVRGMRRPGIGSGHRMSPRVGMGWGGEPRRYRQFRGRGG